MIEQIAIASSEPEKLKHALANVLGIDEWFTDLVRAEGPVFGIPSKNKAQLNFNYQLGLFEFEIIKYEEGENWHEHRVHGGKNFLSHLGFHIEDPDEFEKSYNNLKGCFEIAQEVKTKHHTNPQIADNRRYRYVIFDSNEILGFDLKIIQRLNIDGSPYLKSVEDKLQNIEERIKEAQQSLIQMKLDQTRLRSLS